MKSPRPSPAPKERPSPPEHPSADRPALPTDAEQRERAAYLERNLWLAFIGLLLFFLSLWGV